MPCKRPATMSPKKDCGFELQHDNLSCTPGKMTKIKLKNMGPSNAVVRLCETSKVLGYSTACEYVHRLANVHIRRDGKKEKITTVRFICPKLRSSKEPGGLFSILVASILPNKPVPKVVYSF